MMTDNLQYDEFGPCAPGDEPDTSDIPEAGKEFFERATLRRPAAEETEFNLGDLGEGGAEPVRRTARERLPDQIIDAINSLVAAQIAFAGSVGFERQTAAMAAQGTAEDRLRDLLREVISAR
jgi:hypothetical protein